MVDEGLGLARALRDAEHVQEQLLDQLQVRLRVEGGVEGEDGPRPLQAVAGEVELGHRVHCTKWQGLVSLMGYRVEREREKEI